MATGAKEAMTNRPIDLFSPEFTIGEEECEGNLWVTIPAVMFSGLIGVALAYWALYEYFWANPWPRGPFFSCRLVYVVVAPLSRCSK